MYITWSTTCRCSKCVVRTHTMCWHTIQENHSCPSAFVALLHNPRHRARHSHPSHHHLLLLRNERSQVARGNPLRDPPAMHHPRLRRLLRHPALRHRPALEDPPHVHAAPRLTAKPSCPRNSYTRSCCPASPDPSDFLAFQRYGTVPRWKTHPARVRLRARGTCGSCARGGGAAVHGVHIWETRHTKTLPARGVRPTARGRRREGQRMAAAAWCTRSCSGAGLGDVQGLSGWSTPMDGTYAPRARESGGDRCASLQH